MNGRHFVRGAGNFDEFREFGLNDCGIGTLTPRGRGKKALGQLAEIAPIKIDLMDILIRSAGEILHGIDESGPADI